MSAQNSARNLSSYDVNGTFSRNNLSGLRNTLISEYSSLTKIQKIHLAKHKDDFITLVSHELKTPVTSLKALGQFLEYKFNSNNEQTSVQFMKKLNFQIDKLSLLIRELIDISRMDVNQEDWERELFDFDALVSKIIEDIQYSSKTHKIIKYGYTRSFIYGDSVRIGQAITNVLHNAIKFSPGTREIVVTSGKVGDDLRICVRDYGIGIEPADQVHIFEKFYRVEKPDNETYGGLGLGLYITSEIIKGHSGKLWVESEKNKGSQFWIELPSYTV